MIREDPLGLDLIYIQAKSWEKTVGRPDIQAFAGALQGKQAAKGIFITTSRFTPEAEEYVRSIPSRVILVDGRRLADLMIEHDVGVSVRDTYNLKEIDLSFFSTDGESATPWPYAGWRIRLSPHPDVARIGCVRQPVPA